MRKLMVVAALSLVVGACTSIGDLVDQANQIVGSGVGATEERPVGAFDTIRFEALGDVHITIGTSESLTIEADDNLLERITSEVRGSTLVISLERGFAIVPKHGVTYGITVPSLRLLDVSGVGDIEVGPIEAKEFKLDLSGVGDVWLTGVDVDLLTIDYSGVGSVAARGVAVRQDVSLSGVGSYDGADLETRETTIAASGTGGATIWATDSVDITASGVGSVRYWGNPTDTSVTSSGIGGIESLGDR
jgi:hypothetical protein